MRYVAISIHGNYLSLSGGSPGSSIEEALAVAVGGLIMANGTGIGAPSIFERVEQGENQVALRMLDGAWLTVVGDRVGRSYDGGDVLTEVWWPDDRISLRAPNGMFLCAERGGGSELVVNRPEAGDWEKFYYEQVPDALLPAQEPEDTRVGDAISGSAIDAVRQEAESSRIDVATSRTDVLGAGTESDAASVTRRRFP